MTELNSGDLRHRLSIEKKTSEMGMRGQQIDKWEEIGRMWAAITPIWGQELELARKRQENITVKIVTRKQLAREMDPSYRLRHHDDVYNIGFVQMQGADLRDIYLMCSRTRD
jgi:SPP1 family predicted phage head-tail adaptor